ncbi:Protein farnesyltransferase subunit beta [Thelohanellus kitauei]|uniref:Protein farnesyltransferase subunit beta n=1 Tax=Thelohanellus kitauei TaxID=669202 RepID=A0A0C2N8I1_THEKT|nr:Protein farnesyltransferase subunit beta [Thelohanellus kitauei]
MEKLSDLISRFVQGHESVGSPSVVQQALTRELVLNKYKENEGLENSVKLLKEETTQYILKLFEQLPERFISYLSCQPWYLFYVLHSLELIGAPQVNLKFVYDRLKECKLESGGFGGGLLQEAHLGCTFAAVCCVLTVGSYYPDALQLIETRQLVKFINRCRNNDGSYRISPKHENDLRAIYCAIAIMRLTNCFDDKLFQGTSDYIVNCQNYDGGFGAFPGAESHAGYTYCAFASLVLLNEENRIDRHRLLNWVVHRQMTFEGGFTGRCNKLVDSCYSFWCGSLIPIIQAGFDLFLDSTPHRILNREANQYYLLLCAQTLTGGFTDRPPHLPDAYHTCYALSSLSLSQHSFIADHDSHDPVGDCNNYLEKVHPIYNISQAAYDFALKKFYNNDPYD